MLTIDGYNIFRGWWWVLLCSNEKFPITNVQTFDDETCQALVCTSLHSWLLSAKLQVLYKPYLLVRTTKMTINCVCLVFQSSSYWLIYLLIVSWWNPFCTVQCQATYVVPILKSLFITSLYRSTPLILYLLLLLTLWNQHSIALI